MEVLKSLNIKSPILLLKVLNDGNFAIIDAQNTLRIIDSNDYKVIGGFKSNIAHERLVGSHVDVTPDAKYSISIIPGVNKAALFSVNKKELLYKVGRHQGDVESVAIDPNSRYCVTCGQDGKVFAWVLKAARLAFSMPIHTDFVTTVAFNETGQWIATGSFDRTINILNLATMKHPLKLRGHSSAIVKIVFLPEARMLSADKEGTLIVWDMIDGKVLHRLTKMNDDITALSISSDSHFAFVGTKLGYVGLYNLESMELLTPRYLKESEQITSIAYLADGFRLIIGTVEGNVRVYSLFGDQEKYMQMLREHQYKEFYDALDKNPILFYSKVYEMAERIWGDIQKKARAYLEKGDRPKAKELFDLFAGIPKKNPLITQMLRDYEKYGQFQACVNEGRLPLAYSMAKQYPAFQDSEPFRKAELRWKKLFAKAQELILAPNGDEQAKTLLAPYRGISEKTLLIQQLFEERKKYEYFKKVIAQSDYVKFFDLVRILPFLKEFAEYTAVMDYGDKLYIQSQKAYRAGDYATARKGCEILVAFPDYAKESQEMLETIRVKHLFYDAIASNNLINAFAYLNSYPLLYETPEAQVLERQWNVIVDNAQRYAAKGLVRETAEVFEIYQSVKDKYSAMGSVFAQCYSAQLEQKLREKASQNILEQGIRQYVALFGIDDMIAQVFEYFKRNYKTQIDLDTLKQGSLETWTPAMIIDDITRSG
ncbi:WD40 repeat domain-containing protein [Sulfuricurvum sp.]|uniref:WD40 repeat domain-containing protein n=1 Tax=Sulfuricurvum sp. TaxID=2025608 RepID=UPI003562C773